MRDKHFIQNNELERRNTIINRLKDKVVKRQKIIEKAEMLSKLMFGRN